MYRAFGELKVKSRVIALALIVAVPNAAPAEPLKPTSKWNVDYDVAQCTASRDYGTEAKPLLLILKPSPFGGVMRVLLVSPGGSALPASEQDASVQFAGHERIRTKALKYSSGDRKMSIRAINLPLDTIKASQAAASLEITSSGVDRSFAIDNIGPVLVELEKCRTDLLDMYNASRARIKDAPSPIKPLRELFSAADYPIMARIQRDQGAVDISLLVDETGKVADCSVDASAGYATLDTMSCYIIQQRASFKPAVGTDGKPARSIYTQRIVWRMG